MGKSLKRPQRLGGGGTTGGALTGPPMPPMPGGPPMPPMPGGPPMPPNPWAAPPMSATRARMCQLLAPRKGPSAAERRRRRREARTHLGRLLVLLVLVDEAAPVGLQPLALDLVLLDERPVLLLLLVLLHDLHLQVAAGLRPLAVLRVLRGGSARSGGNNQAGADPRSKLSHRILRVHLLGELNVDGVVLATALRPRAARRAQ
jgi:hypothetical protein